MKKTNIIHVGKLIAISPLFLLPHLWGQEKGTGDFEPKRSGLTYGNYEGRLNGVEFNRFTDSMPLSFFSGACPAPSTLAKRVNGTPSAPYREVLSVMTPEEKKVAFDPKKSDERDFLKIGILKSNGSAHPYDNDLEDQEVTPKSGDILRFMVFLHNNAMENKPDVHTAKDTQVTIDWSEIENPRAMISAKNGNPETISDGASIPKNPSTRVLIPTGTAFYLDASRPKDGGITIKPSSQTENSIKFKLGDQKPGFAYYRVVYVDFRVR